MKILSVTQETLPLLKGLIANLGEAAKTFRYFQKRDAAITLNHLATVLVVEEEQAVGYGHLEMEGEDTWLGITVVPTHAGKGLGKIIMRELIDRAKQASVQRISLTVDKGNSGAIALYEKCGFEKTADRPTLYKYELNLSQTALC